MSSAWYYANGDERVGPYDAATVQKLISGGVISPDTWLIQAGMADWISVADSPFARFLNTASPTAVSVPIAVSSKAWRYPRKLLCGYGSLVMMFVVGGWHSGLAVYVMFGCLFAAIELGHLTLRDIRLGRTSVKAKRSARIFIVVAYVLFTLSAALFVMGMAGRD